MRKRISYLLSALIALTLTFIACGGGGKKDVAVTGVSLNKPALTLAVNGTEKLLPAISPADATNKNVTWSSSDTAIATVSNDGAVTGAAVGSATITVATVDGNKTADCNVTVIVPVASISLNETEITLMASRSLSLTATVAPNDATNKNVTWSSSDTDTATVSNGVVTGVTQGEATITVTSVQDAAKKAQCAVTVTPLVIPVTEITLNKTLLTLDIDQEETLTATVLPANATNPAIIWSSNMPSIAGVSQEGVVKALTGGTATITASSVAWPTIEAECVVNVKGIVLAEAVVISPESISIQVGQTYQLTADVFPENTTNKTVTWSAYPAYRATVDENGLVTALQQGSCTIYANSTDGGEATTGTCFVTIAPVYATGVKVFPEVAEVYQNEGFQLTYELIPPGAISDEVYFNTSNSSQLRISSTGWVTPLTVGRNEAYVRMYDNPDIVGVCVVYCVNSGNKSDVYVAGHNEIDGSPGATNNRAPFVAKNGEVSYLFTPDQVEKKAGAYSVFVADNSPYAAGFDDGADGIKRAVIWKDGLAEPWRILAKPLGANVPSFAKDLFVFGQQVYAAGQHGNVPYIWADNAPQSLPITGASGGVNSTAATVLSGAVVYAAGYDYISGSMNAVLWQGGTRTGLHPAGASMSEATSVYVSEYGYSPYTPTAFVAGYYVDADSNTTVPVVWRNNASNMITLPLLPGAHSGWAESVFAYDRASGVTACIGVAGYCATRDASSGEDYHTAVFWKNTSWNPSGPGGNYQGDFSVTPLTPQTPNVDSRAYGVYLRTVGSLYSAVFATGVVADKEAGTWEVKVWKDGIPIQTIPSTPPQSGNQAERTYPSSIFVANRPAD